MNREETLTWIEVVLDSLDDQEMMAIIRESAERYKADNNTATADQLHAIARAIAVVRQNRAENL